MSHKGLVSLGILAVTAALVSSGCGHWCHRHHGMSQEKLDKIEKHIASKLDLNKDQKEKFSVIMKRFSEKLPQMKTHREKMTDVLITQFGSEKFDSVALNSEMDAAAKDFTDVRKLMVQSVADFYQILDPEQRKKAADIMKKYRECFGK
ncbi:MAG: Spy/CpxP family protein refolding chaperone [Spirochaetia bacterium]|nr:Spy/CpxP family protein refolding chaperone [Spirochaetia bacterium]